MITQVLAALILTASVWGFKQGSARGRMGLQRWVAMSESTAQQPSSKKAYRIFNAASLPELLNPISEAEAKSLDKVQDVLKKAGKCSGPLVIYDGDEYRPLMSNIDSNVKILWSFLTLPCRFNFGKEV